jgi:hypothetical protein
MTQTIINLGTGGAALNGQNGSTAGADSNDARFLDWPGDNAGNYVYLPGVAGNRMTLAHDAAFNVTGDLDLRVYVALDDYSNGTFQSLIGQITTGNRQYVLRINTTGFPQLLWSENGSALITAASTVAMPTSDGDPVWLRATLDVDDGAGGYEVTFYTSSNGSSWSTLDTITGGSTTSIVSGLTEGMAIGDQQVSGSGNVAAGKIYRAQILDGIGGTTVLDVDTSVITTGAATSFNALTGQTVTINRSTAGRKAVAVVSPVWLFGTDDYMEVANDALINFGAADSFTVLAVIRQWATPTSFGMYVHKRDGTSAGYVLQSNGTSLATSNAVAGGGVNVSRASTGFSAGQTVAAAFVVDRSAQTIEPFINGLSNSTSSISTVGNPTNTLPLRIGRRADGAAYQDFELLSVAVFRRALTQSELTAISNYYSTRWP